MDLTRVIRRLAGILLAAVLAVAPAAGTLLAPTAPGRATEPAGIAAWRADHLPPGTDPVTVHRFFAGLPAGRAARLAAERPAVVGALDGAPAGLRYAANRAAMRAAGTPYDRWPGHYLLFDPRGDGRAARVFGDLAGADRIAVLVPGVDSRLDNFVSGLGGARYRAPVVQAGNLYRAARSAAPGARTAVVAWLGYATPHGVGRAAAREDLAADGAAGLVRFVRGLTVLRPHATITVLGHSYGSTVAGLAAGRLPRQVRDIAVFGSPGMGVDRAADLGTRARVWAGLAPGDWIRWVPGVRLLGLGHGTSPTDPPFGARPLPTAGVTDHDHYLYPGTASLAALAAIVTGTEPTGARS